MENDADVLIDIVEGDVCDFPSALEGSGIKCRYVFLPAPVDVLVNEYTSLHAIEPLGRKAIVSSMQREEERLSILMSYINSIEVSGLPLIIIDPYFFSVNDSDKEEYVITIQNLLCSSKASELTVITKPKYDSDLAIEVKKRVEDNIPLKIIESSDFHDRFWLSPERKRGFSMGTSLNGLGKRISCIQHLKKEDVQDILALISEQIS